MKKPIIATILVAFALVGCSGLPDNPGENYKPPTNAHFDAQIEKIKNDPNMTEDAKAQAINGIEISRKMSQQGANKGAGKNGG